MQAADLMRQMLAALNCTEALEVEKLRNGQTLEGGSGEGSALIDEAEERDDTLGMPISTAEPWGFWRQLQSCLLLEKTVERIEGGDEGHDRVRVTLTVHNTAPDSKDLPAVHFKSVIINSIPVDVHLHIEGM